MSRSALAMLSEAESSMSSSRRASSVRVNEPGDAHEVEADRVADTVSRGGRLAGWSLSTTRAGGVQREGAPPPAAASTSLSDVAAGVAPAVLATPQGKQVVDAATAVIGTPVGGSITGAAAVGIISGLAKAKKPLPAQLPEIPLDFIKKGLSVKLTWNGPVNAPTDGSIVLKYEPKGEEKKPQTTGQKIAAETKALVADREQFKPSAGPGPTAGPLAGPLTDQARMDRMVANYNQQKLAEIGSFVRPLPGVPAAPVAEKKPEAAPAPAPETKKEEVPVQRKAESAAPVQTASADVDAVVRGAGRPLDASTRRLMESRMGFDFGKVRVHADEHAGDSAEALNARAYTTGEHVVFAPGRYAPQSAEGQRLLAHELTHVVQQGKAESRPAYGLKNFPWQRQIEEGLGMPIAGSAVVDPLACRRQGVRAFTRDQVVHFNHERPELTVAAHEAVHLAQHGGRTHEAGLGPEQHAHTAANLIGRGRSARGLMGPAGASVPRGTRAYTEVPVASQSATEWNAKLPLRVADSGQMAVGKGGTGNDFWAAPALITQSNGILASRKSVIRLNALSDTLSGTTPGGGAKVDLAKVSPKNMANKTEGDFMDLWADCGKSARDVMGAGKGSGGGQMTASFDAPEKPPRWLKMLGAIPLLLSGTPHVVEQKTAASGDPDAMKQEIFNTKLGGTGDEGLKKYQALSPGEKDKFDRETKINRYAAPTAGQGYTMSSGGANIPGMKTWNFHWAGVVMNSSGDNVTLENFSVSDPAVQNGDWQFDMYGTAAKAGQTFYDQHKATGQHGDAPTAMKVEKDG